MKKLHRDGVSADGDTKNDVRIHRQRDGVLCVCDVKACLEVVELSRESRQWLGTDRWVVGRPLHCQWMCGRGRRAGRGPTATG